MIEHRWYGPAALVEAARDALPRDAAEVNIVIPPHGVPLRVLDGTAAISFTSRIARIPPPGVLDDKPQLITALHGSMAAVIEDPG